MDRAQERFACALIQAARMQHSAVWRIVPSEHPELNMRLLIVAAFAGCGALSLPTSARAEPWCAYYDAYTYTCGFTSFEQCLATARGAGGECRPDYRAAAEQRTRADGRRSRQRRERD
jgi:hypothetical protein